MAVCKRKVTKVNVNMSDWLVSHIRIKKITIFILKSISSYLFLFLSVSPDDIMYFVLQSLHEIVIKSYFFLAAYNN